MTIRRTQESIRNVSVSSLLDPALSAARDALQRYLEKELRAQFGSNWQDTLERDRAARGMSDRWDWGSISYRLGHFRSPQAGFASGPISEPLVALARLAKAYRNQFQHEELTDNQVRHAVMGLALLQEAMGNRTLAEDTRKALAVWEGPSRGAKVTRARPAKAKAAKRAPAKAKTATRKPAAKSRRPSPAKRR